jgi:hypothetical protein
MRAHEEAFPGMIGQIRQSQQQLWELTNTALPTDNDGLETDAKHIAQQAFPGGHWPDDLSPWPTMHLNLAVMLLNRGRLLDALMHGVRGFMFLSRRSGEGWVGHLFIFAQITSEVLIQFDWEEPCENLAFLTRTQLQDVFCGYLYELSLAANQVFGSRAGFAQAVQNWYLNYMKFAGIMVPGIHVFAERFDFAQSRLLLWAGVDEKKGITITQ